MTRIRRQIPYFSTITHTTRFFQFAVFILHFAILLTCTNALAGTIGKITGQATDQDGNPIPGVGIVIEGSKRGTESDTEGIYFLLSVDPGYHTITTQMIGLEPNRENLLHFPV